MKISFFTMWNYLEKVCTLTTDSPEERRRKVTLVVITLLCCLIGILSVTNTYMSAEPLHVTFVPLSFTVISGFAFFLFVITKRFSILLYSFLMLILCIPVIFQASIGGFTEPGSIPIIAWSVLAPFGSLMFQNTHKAVKWFVAYLVLVLVSLYFDGFFSQFAGPTSHSELIIAHGINIVGLSITIFLTLWYFINAFQNEHARAEGLVISLQDTNKELEMTMEELKRTQSELVQSEKMASLGELTAGICHEINNPVGAINSANDTISRCIKKLEINTSDTSNGRHDDNQRLHKVMKILESNVGVIDEAGNRVSALVKSLKNFARLDEAEYQIADVHEGIDSSLAILNTMVQGRITVEKQYGAIPKIGCYPGLLNQVFINILKNAAEAIEGSGTINIQTSLNDNGIGIRISDNGKGISADKLEKLFDISINRDKSTAKMGFGLSTAYTIIKKHKGKIEAQSELEKGTTISILLPTG